MKIIREVVGKEMDDFDKKILEEIRRGYTCKEIAARNGKTIHFVSYRIRVMKKHYECLSIPQLVTKYMTGE